MGFDSMLDGVLNRAYNGSMEHKRPADHVVERLSKCRWIGRSIIHDKTGPFVESKMEWTEKGLRRIRAIYKILDELGYTKIKHGGELDFLAGLVIRDGKPPDSDPGEQTSRIFPRRR